MVLGMHGNQVHIGIKAPKNWLGASVEAAEVVAVA
jgi:sRNA-binding carbon storage regulator CsrA